MVLPSTATTLRLAMVPVRVQNQDLRRVLRPVGSRFRRTRRMVDSKGGSCPAARPRDHRSAAVRSVVCSPIGVRLRHLAVTTATQAPTLSSASSFLCKRWVGLLVWWQFLRGFLGWCS